MKRVTYGCIAFATLALCALGETGELRLPDPPDNATLTAADERVLLSIRERMLEEMRRYGIAPSKADEETAFAKYVSAWQKKSLQAQSIVDEENKPFSVSGTIADSSGKKLSKALLQFDVSISRTVGKQFRSIQELKVPLEIEAGDNGEVVATNLACRSLTLTNVLGDGVSYELTNGERLRLTAQSRMPIAIVVRARAR